MSIEAAPLELTEEQAEGLLDFYHHTEKEVQSSTALAIVMAVARETVLRGECSVSHGEFRRRTGACRRTIDYAVKRLKKLELIERIGTTEGGVAIYRANLERDAHGLV